MLEKIIELIEIMKIKRKLTNTGISERMNVTRQAVQKRLNKENFSIKDLEFFASALDCDIEISLVMKDSDEKLTVSSLK